MKMMAVGLEIRKHKKYYGSRRGKTRVLLDEMER